MSPGAASRQRTEPLPRSKSRSVSLPVTLVLLGLGLLISLGSLTSGETGPLLVTAVGAGASLLSAAVGLGLGLLSALGPPFGAALLRRLVELFGTLPTLVGALLLLMWSPHWLTLLLLVGLLRGVRIARVTAPELRRLARQPFAEASLALGAPLTRRIQRDLLPPLWPLLAAEAASGTLWTLALVVASGLTGAPLPAVIPAHPLSGSAGALWLIGAGLISLGLARVLLSAMPRDQC